MALTAYLMLPAVREPRDALREGVEVREVPLRADLGYDGALFIADRQPGRPPWAGLAEEVAAEPLPDISTLFPAAVLCILVETRVLAITFGLGRTVIDTSKAERDFGLRATLNTVDPDALQSIDTAVIEDIVVRTRRQVSRASKTDAFGIDDRRDMFRAVTGRPRDTDLGTRIGGSQSVTVARSVRAREVGQLGRRLVDAFSGTDYQERFGFIDRVRAIERGSRTDELDQLALSAVRGEGGDEPYLAPPAIVDWEAIAGFRYAGESADVPPHVELDLAPAREALGDPDALSLEALKRPSITVVLGDGSEPARWSLYQCLVWEAEIQGQRHVLSEGSWFLVDRDFARDIDEQVAVISRSDLVLAESNHDETEGVYNERAAREGGFLLLDKDLLKVGTGRYREIEVCDILCADPRRLVHVKRKTRSSTLSHLLAQGRISAQVLKSDRRAREALRAKISAHETTDAAALEALREPFRATDWEVVYGIVAPNASELPDALSFFSKLNLAHTAALVRDELDFTMTVLGIAELPADPAPA